MAIPVCSKRPIQSPQCTGASLVVARLADGHSKVQSAPGYGMGRSEERGGSTGMVCTAQYLSALVSSATTM